MIDPEDFILQLPKISEANFDYMALQLFEYQWYQNPTYNLYCSQLGKNPDNVHNITEIPFLPISFFKRHQIKTGRWEEKKIYLSSATTSMTRSRHFIKNNQDYLKMAAQTFEQLVGPIKNHLILALLPSYQDQGGSSLISMVDHFMELSERGKHYFGSHQSDDLLQILKKSTSEKVYLFGVSYALLDFVEAHSGKFPNLTVIETGGMKGRRQEIIRTELHAQLEKGLTPERIMSEYGMTELTVQAYANGQFFQLPPWAKVLLRDPNDPFGWVKNGKTGGINLIDLGNVNSCAFLETQDLGRMGANSTFEVLGRYDNSDIRGCNLMAESL